LAVLSAEILTQNLSNTEQMLRTNQNGAMEQRLTKQRDKPGRENMRPD
jgi:hypothetical protein